ncbi:MAG: 3-phosphoserine/phosphohydroxythreonine transaminase [Gammaproteobacteria bacterium]
MARSYNFSPGPAVLPHEVLLQAQQEFLEWSEGVSALEHSHRSPIFMELAATLREQFREILNIPKNYHILFMQAGGTAQFAAVPLNLLRGKNTADYVATGFWSERAIAEAKLYCNVNVVASNAHLNYAAIPDFSTWKLNPEAPFLHYVTNETIHGIEFPYVPKIGNVPLVADMSSNILSKPIDVSDYGLIYAGAQKNIAPAGLTLVIVREDLVGHANPMTPAILDYKRFVPDGFYNTPVTFSFYMAHLALSWLKKQGGLPAMDELNQRKAKDLYATIDNSNGFYINNVQPEFRSRMNIPFGLTNTQLEEDFLRDASAEGLVNLRGHKSVGGIRASIYNAMPEAGVRSLIEFMNFFAQRYG